MVSLLLWAAVRGQALPIIPQPQEMEWLQGSFSLSDIKTVNSYWPDYADTVAFRQLGEALNEFGLRFRRSELKEARLLAGLFPQMEAFPKMGKTADFIRDPRIGEQGYHLVITPQNILLLAQTNTGLFYGVQTLRQLLRIYGPSGQLPCLRITDFPAFGFRGVMDDISRGPVPNTAFMMEQIRRLSELKINYLNFNIGNTTAIPGQEAIAVSDPITLEEWDSLSAYAGRHHLHLIGGFQSLGHAENILAHDAYRSLGQTKRMFRPADPDVQALLLEIYEKMLPAFNSRYFNIHCDEVADLEGMSAPPAEIAYIDHVRPLLSYLISRGKEPMLWGDMLRHYPDLADELPMGTVLLPRGGADTDIEALLTPLRDRQLPYIACPDIPNSRRLLPQLDEALANIRGFAAAADTLGALGIMATVWDEGGHSFFTHDWYAIAYSAEQSWRPDPQDSIGEFDHRFSRTWMGDRAILLPRLQRTLNQLAALEPTWRMQDEVLYQRLVPNFGEQHSLDTIAWAQVREQAREGRRLAAMLERTADAGSYAARDQPYWRLIADLYLTLADTRFSLLELKRKYQEAAQVSTTDSLAAKELMKGIFVEGLAMSDRWEQLRALFEARWLAENRPHALDSIALPYAERQQRLRRLAGGLLVMSTLNDPKDSTGWLSPRQIGLEVLPLSRTYLTEWMISRSDEISTVEPAFLTSRGDAPVRFSDPGMFYRLEDGYPLEWSAYRSPAADWVALADALTIDTTAVAYAYCRIDSPDRASVPALIAFDGRLSIWLDGQPVFESAENDDQREERCSLPLQKGSNHLLIRLEGPPRKQRFSLSLPEREIRKERHRYYLLEE